MAGMSVSDFELFINHQIKVQEQIEACLWRLEALITVAVMVKGFYELSESILNSYFLAVGDLITEASKINQVNLDNLLKQDR